MDTHLALSHGAGEELAFEVAEKDLIDMLSIGKACKSQADLLAILTPVTSGDSLGFGYSLEASIKLKFSILKQGEVKLHLADDCFE